MSYPASIKRLDDALSATDATALSVKAETQGLRNRSAAGAVERTAFLSLIRRIDGAIDIWDQTAALPGIIAFARDQKGDQGLDLSAEFSAMRAAAVDLQDWLFAVFPKDVGTGAWLVEEYSAEGIATALTFSTAQLSGFLTRADTLTATIG